MAATNGQQADTPEQPQDLVKLVPPGTIIPPKALRESRIEKVAAYVARSGDKLEEKVRAGGQAPYVDPEDPYHAYYKWRVEEIRAGRGFDESTRAIARKTEVTFQGKDSAPKPPPEYQFSARMPNISAQDLEIVKLTALYAAKNGKSWITQLSQRESGNFQFDFLRPQHSLNMYFNRLMEQYKDLIEGETAKNGAPQKKRVAELESTVADRFSVLERAKKRAEYRQWQDKQKVEKEEKEEKERIAFAQIDWHDFSVVATITFDEGDEHAEMAPPKSKNDMLSLSLEEKAKMRIDPSRRLEEAVPSFDDYTDIFGQQQQMPAAQMPQTYTPQPPPSASPAQAAPYAAPPSVQEERERVRANLTKNNQPARVRTNYVPAAQRGKQAQNTSICPICKQAIPNDEMEHHMKIESLSPEWREQMAKNQQRSSTTNLATADVANNLKRLASQRTDVFDPITGQAITPEEQERRKRAELSAYDGSAQQYQQHPLPPGPFPPGTERPDVHEQIRYLHDKYKK
ncbi:Pre-mRNA-splicing factor [Lecanosticta acicola]|uniref:Pre-mRNA-splicing factor n=1 Tax=Lecanosticta acicola TaxID=111012 RepID=A0AAI8W2L9_9PEZI|nr:Pre-mRNA-splicing factor [Lecanosticta acicola]